MTVAKDLIRNAVGRVFDSHFDHIDCSAIVNWFSDGGTLRVGDSDTAEQLLVSLGRISGLLEAAVQAGLADPNRPGVTVAACELVLEGLHAKKKISRSDERVYAAAKKEARARAYESLDRSRRIN
jgi:magnesium chelatase subunit I